MIGLLAVDIVLGTPGGVTAPELDPTHPTGAAVIALLRGDQP